MYKISLWNLVILCSLLLSFVGLNLYLIQRLKKLRQDRETFCKAVQNTIEDGEKRLIFVPENHPDAEMIFSINGLLSAFHAERAAIVKRERERKQLFANLSHDVRTPLASIIGYLEAIRLGYAKDEEQEYIQIVECKAQALKHYLDSLFSMASIDAGELSIILESVDLNEAVRECLLSFSPLLTANDVKLLADISDEAMGVSIDKMAFSRLFNNLVQNALKFGLEGGVLGIHTWHDEKNGYLEIWDRGKGIEQSDLPFVFDRLYRGDESRSTCGSGIGLYVVKELINRMNGTVRMSSIPYERTGAVMSFPLVSSACKTL